MQGYYCVARLASDVDLTYTPNGKAVCSFVVAVKDAFRKGEDGQPYTHFFPVQAWEKTAEFIAEHFTKGKEIGLQGELSQRRWTDAETQKPRSKVEIVARQASFIGPKPAEQGNAGTGEEYADA